MGKEEGRKDVRVRRKDDDEGGGREERGTGKDQARRR